LKGSDVSNFSNAGPLDIRELSDAECERHLKDLDTYGYTIVTGFMAARLVREIKELVDGYWTQVAETAYKGRPQRDANDRVVYNLQNRDKRFIDLLSNSVIKRICIEKLNDRYYRFLPDDRPNYILNYYNARTSGDALDLHIDSHVPNPGQWCIAMQAVYLLDDMDEANGCTVVVPGSHRSGEFTDRSLENVVPVVAAAGDLVIWDSKLWHGARANRSKISRWALIATLTQWWIKQSMDVTRSLPNEIYRQLDDEQKALLGFCSIPPFDEYERINTKCGYSDLKPSMRDYYSR
jgi:Phytanoyl-CoA dioxygenase (PhyH)